MKLLAVLLIAIAGCAHAKTTPWDDCSILCNAYSGDAVRSCGDATSLDLCICKPKPIPPVGI
jgi:hypothetical protein